MKKAAALLAILAVALAAALWMNRKSAADQVQRAAADISSLSNHLAEVEMKLNHQERVSLSLGSNLTNRADELANSASELATARARLAQSQNETRAVQQELENARSGLQITHAQLADLSNRIEELVVEVRRKGDEISRVQADLAKAQNRNQELAHQLGEVQRENDQMARQLNDPELLRAQIATLKRQEAAATRQTTNARPDYRLDLELLPDGSVRLVPPPTSTASNL